MNTEPYNMALKRQFFTERLIEKGVTHSLTGQDITQLDYEDLKQVWVQTQAREINIASDQNRWF